MPDEPMPSKVIKDTLNSQWNSSNVTEPNYIDINDGTAPMRVDFKIQDYVIISSDNPTETEDTIGNWTYGTRVSRVLLEVYTSNSRQRLYNLKQEIRRIMHNRMHSLSDYQRVQYVDFNEITDAAQRLWIGRVSISLVNDAVLLET